MRSKLILLCSMLFILPTVGCTDKDFDRAATIAWMDAFDGTCNSTLPETCPAKHEAIQIAGAKLSAKYGLANDTAIRLAVALDEFKEINGEPTHSDRARLSNRIANQSDYQDLMDAITRARNGDTSEFESRLLIVARHWFPTANDHQIRFSPFETVRIVAKAIATEMQSDVN